jgi:hypothetical protein
MFEKSVFMCPGDYKSRLYKQNLPPQVEKTLILR